MGIGVNFNSGNFIDLMSTSSGVQKNVAVTKDDLQSMTVADESLIRTCSYTRNYDTLDLSEDYYNCTAQADKIRSMFEPCTEYYAQNPWAPEGEIFKKLCSVSMTGKGFTNEELAEHCGNIGKAIDEAYSSGKISQDEFDSLNNELGEYSEHLTSELERVRAIHAEWDWEMSERSKEMWQMVMAGESIDDYGFRGLHGQDLLDYRKEMVGEFLKNFKIDRTEMNDMINKYRYGDTSSEIQTTEDTESMSSEKENMEY
jgi:hypothetical protein